MSSIAQLSPEILAPNADDRRLAADRRSLWRSASASIALHILVFCLLFFMPGVETPADEKPLPIVRLVIEEGHGAAGAAGGGAGDTASSGDTEASTAAATADHASPTAATPSSSANANIEAPPPPAASAPYEPTSVTETAQSPLPPDVPAFAESPPQPSPAGILPPAPTQAPTQAPPPEPRHKPRPPSPKIVHLASPKPAPAPAPVVPQALPTPAQPTQQPIVSTVKDYSHLPPEVAHPSLTESPGPVASADGMTAGAPDAAGAGGRGRGFAGRGRAAFGAGDANDPYDDYLERLQRYIRPYLKTLEAQSPQKEEGRVIVGFTLSRDGTISDVAVEESSGKFNLDHIAVEGVRHASPAPPPPAKDMGDRDRVKLSVPINFTVGLFDRMFH